MEPTVNTPMYRNSEQWSPDSFGKAPVSQSDALLVAFAEKYREEGREDVRQYYKQQLEDKDKLIEKLKREIALAKQTNTTKALASKERNYCCNTALFPKPNFTQIIDALNELVESKREKGKYVLNNKTDWFMGWKCLKYWNLFIGSEYDFIDIVNDCIVPYISDKTRRAKLICSEDNFKNIGRDNPMKDFSVDEWRKKLKSKMENEQHAMHGTLVLDRGVNIMVKLQELLQMHGVDSFYYENKQ